MMTGCRRNPLARTATGLLVLFVLLASISPSAAQNKKRSWEIFIYFGEYGGQTIPSAIQSGVVSTYRLDPGQAARSDPNDSSSPRLCEVCMNIGDTGPDTQIGVDPCPLGGALARDPNLPFYDECDDDVEARYKYNANGIVTNGDVQRNDSEFLLGARIGYNITRHWEVEFDIGFAKQRIDMTKNLLPLLTENVTNPADPFFQRLADFYEFTWANQDFSAIGNNGINEIPNVPQRRFSRNSAADIPAILPNPSAASERFQDVTEFVNRVLLNPGAFRNRANQINVDIFSTGLSGAYNFNTKPDSRIVPYLQAGLGRWIRNYDAPYKGEDSDYFTYGGGARFFVNEIFSFRAEIRNVIFQQETVTMRASLPTQDLIDFQLTGGCLRDQDPPRQQPPIECSVDYVFIQFPNPANQLQLPRGASPGGRASIELITETNDFWEARIGFDVLLGGK